MVKGFILEYDKREGLICKKVKEWEGSLRNNEKGRGFWAKIPFFSLLPSRKTGEARLGAGGGPRRRPRARRRPGPWGKERGRLVGSTPPSISGKKARREGSHGGGRQQARAVWLFNSACTNRLKTDINSCHMDLNPRTYLIKGDELF